ncbi:methylated-DNA--[protein]-cysteine S-methyltransferase [Microbacterium sp. NPDC055910]|uniref:methylated-DNA--[protein]-cysteine S-methyltransferase n=1 Tax=Microbacterium sp. NPDC055910 TaxID=3345659 RepID=UPI0035DD95AB
MTAPTPRFLVHPSPVGDILIVAEGERIVSLAPFDAPLGVELEQLSRRLGAVPEPETTDAAVTAAAQLDEYFAGERRQFTVDLEWRLVRGFRRDALEAACEVPYGETASYGEVAIMAGRPGAARAVGTACATTPFSIVVPAHRVVRADGSLGQYGRHPALKRYLIDMEHAALAGRTGSRGASV